MLNQAFTLTLSSPLILALSSLCLASFQSIQADEKIFVGVDPTQRFRFSGKDFQCYDGSRTIPVLFVNDDYCDCEDGSDEPGTSACTSGQFFCKNQGYMQKLIPSAWVNDGQCDCCDASDEYNSTMSCENTCGMLGEIHRLEQERLRDIAERGSSIRAEYKEQARLKHEQNSQLLEQYKREVSERETAIKRIEEEMNSDFGPQRVFLQLKGKCYAFKEREYTYNLCPFERASQESTIGTQTELGRWAGWAGGAQNLYSRQKYEGGVQCWNGPARSTVVNIACGLEDKITSVTEPSKCEYFFDFVTPAACPEMDPLPEESPQETHVASAMTVEQENEHLEDDSNLDDQSHSSPDQIAGHTPDANVEHDEL